ncbi:uncharacterized protein C8orf74 homolog [Puma concolor]|uniref:Uncharacterized protein C8orf74 homolog n=1 Tax=Puma concolor TaxID=9696 RepID=A0A6P6HRI9_PUMCO|nr:uncharacterized protein C8orf74 homolog [Puma concolor]
MALLTPQGVKKVFQFQKPEGREHLRRLLNWEEFDEVRDSRRSILLDTLYESIIFAVGKGFPWVEVAKVVKFTEELLKETKAMFYFFQELEKLIDEVIHIETECLKELLQYEIQITFDILDLKLQKTLNLNAPIPSPLSITGQPDQDESLKFYKTNKGKKAKAKKK